MFINKQPKIEIYTVYHKQTPIYQNEIVIPIHAGRALNLVDDKPLWDIMIGDDTGDNISSKNKEYAELTALYWMWKNSTADYVGLMHYRRLFLFPTVQEDSRNCNHDILCEYGLTKENVERYLKDYDIILPKKGEGMPFIYAHYNIHHHIADLNLVMEDIAREFPYMTGAMKRALYANYFYFCNIFIMKKEILDEYAAWLFGIFDRTEDRLTHEEGYQIRTPAFLAERLFNVWLEYNKDKYRVGVLDIKRL